MKPIPNYPGYMATECGEIYSTKWGYLKKLSPYPNNKGYLRVTIARGKLRFVHRLVAMTFKPVEGMENLEVNHDDHDITNNHLSNLTWMTRIDNLKHRRKRKGWGIKKAENISDCPF